MTVKRTHRASRRGFTLVELMVVVLILGIITAVALPAYISSINNSRQTAANENARALSAAVQAKAVIVGTYDTNLADYIQDMGGLIPDNPCTGNTTGYTIATTTHGATVTPQTGTYCGTWSPAVYTLGLGK